MLHPGVGDNDEEARDPRAQPHHYGRKPVHPFGDPLLSIEKEPEKSRFEEEAEYAFHGERLADHSPGQLREASPVGSKLELHGDAGDHSENKIDAEDARPKTSRALPLLAVGPE